MDSLQQNASDEDLFATQNTIVENTNTSGNDTDSVVNTILDMESDRSMPNFELKTSIFSDISDEEVVKDTEKILIESQKDNTTIQIPNRFVEPMADTDRDNYSKSRFAKKTEAKSKWAVRLFDEWRASRLELYADRHDIQKLNGDLLTLDNKDWTQIRCCA